MTPPPITLPLVVVVPLPVPCMRVSQSARSLAGRAWQRADAFWLAAVPGCVRPPRAASWRAAPAYRRQAAVSWRASQLAALAACDQAAPEPSTPATMNKAEAVDERSVFNGISLECRCSMRRSSRLAVSARRDFREGFGGCRTAG